MWSDHTRTEGRVNECALVSTYVCTGTRHTHKFCRAVVGDVRVLTTQPLNFDPTECINSEFNLLDSSPNTSSATFTAYVSGIKVQG